MCYNTCMNMPAKIKPPLALKIIKVGNSQGIILPKDMLAKLGVGLGDELDVVDQGDGLVIRRHDAGFAAQMEAARAVMKKRRAALRELAK